MRDIKNDSVVQNRVNLQKQVVCIYFKIYSFDPHRYNSYYILMQINHDQPKITNHLEFNNEIIRNNTNHQNITSFDTLQRKIQDNAKGITTQPINNSINNHPPSFLKGTQQIEINPSSQKKKTTDIEIENISNLADELILQDFETQTKVPQKSSSKRSQSKNINLLIQSIKTQIITKIADHDRFVLNTGLTPSPSQIQDCVQLLTKELPYLRIDLILGTLHKLVHAQCTQMEQSSSQENGSVNSLGAESRYSMDYTKANSSIRAQNAVSMPLDQRLTQQKKIAISYLNHGYGVRVLRQHISDPNINPTRYNNVITTIMKLAFRKLQDFIKSMGKPVVTINSQDQKIIRAPLTNCQKWLPPDELQAFYKFIKLACNIETNSDIPPATAIKLYNSCLRQLRQRQTPDYQQRQNNKNKLSKRMPRITHSMYSNSAFYHGLPQQRYPPPNFQSQQPLPLRNTYQSFNNNYPIGNREMSQQRYRNNNEPINLNISGMAPWQHPGSSQYNRPILYNSKSGQQVRY